MIESFIFKIVEQTEVSKTSAECPYKAALIDEILAREERQETQGETHIIPSKSEPNK